MNQFELKLDAKLTRDLLSVVGAEYSFLERLKNKHFGIGHLRYISGNSTLDEFYDRHNHTIKTHFDWTKKGAVIRLRTISKIYAIGLGENGFNKIKLTKNPDYILAMPFLPFWTLLRLGVPIEIAKWFRFRGDKFIEGKCEIEIDHNDVTMNFELSGDLWADCLTTFRIQRIREKIFIEDRRTWLTENGFRVNSGSSSRALSKTNSQRIN